MQRSRVLHLLAVLMLTACGGGGATSETAPPPTDRLPLGTGVMKLEASPYRNSMPGPPATGPCQNFIVPVALAPVEGGLPASISITTVSLFIGSEQIWSAPVTEQGVDNGKLRGVARGCANARTTPGREVRVVAHVNAGISPHTIYVDATITEVF